jgi:hypothetical protein
VSSLWTSALVFGFLKTFTEKIRRRRRVTQRNIFESFVKYIPLFLVIILSFSSCGKKKPVQKPVQEEASAVSDSTYIFDGKTLDGWEITNFGPQGPVEVSGGRILLGMGDGCTGITYKKNFPVLNYEVTLEAMRVTGNDFFCGLTFPAGKSSCSLIVGGWGGTVVGLSSIDGKDAAENETTKLMKFEKGLWYSIRLEVTDKNIRAWINESSVVDFTINGKKLSIRPEVHLSLPFGITSWNTSAALRNIRVRRI